MPCFSAPNEVATGSFTGQTSTMSPTTIFTPSASGMFRVSMTGIATAGTPALFAHLDWTNENSSSESKTSGEFTASQSLDFSSLIYAQSGDAIQVWGELNAGTGTYNLHYVVEQL